MLEQKDIEAHHRRVKRMDRIDSMPKDMRELVHEHGLTVVDAFLACGVTKARHMRHLIKTIKQGGYEIGRRGKNYMPEGWGVSYEMVMVPSEPTRRMVEASMAEVANFDIECTKYEKHRRRLVAAIKAAK